MSEGWIKLHRKTLECPLVMVDADHLAIWVYILLKATHKEIPVLFGTEKRILKPGQFITGMTQMEKDLGVNRTKIFRVLKRYESDMQIETQSCSKGTLISVVNWDKYQINETQNETQVKRKRNASETQVNTNKNIKNDKNEINNNHIGSFGSQKVDDLFAEFVKMRKQMKKPMTEHAIELAIAKLEKMSGGIEETAIKIIEQTLEHSWQTFYELKADSKPAIKHSTGTKFNNFEQTQNYDMSNLEKMLLS